MHILFIGRDKPGALAVRIDNRPAHLAYLAENAGAIKIAGPYLDEPSGEPRGSVLIVEADDVAAAKMLLDKDPYAIAGLFAEVEIRPWRWVVGVPA
jgi:uncharacterized protein YciI